MENASIESLTLMALAGAVIKSDGDAKTTNSTRRARTADGEKYAEEKQTVA